MKILVTGGAGFIGSHLAERLVAAGHEVITLDNLSTGRISYMDSVIHHQSHTFVEGSAADRVLIQKLMKECDTVYHLAAMLGVKNTVENPLEVIEGNIDGTRVILETAFQERKKVIFSSTSEIYGKNNHLPFREDSDRVLGTPSIHRWCYATAKALDEHMCFAYASKGLPVTVIRYFNTYGPRQNSSQYGGVVSRFIRAALNNERMEVYGDGTQIRCFTSVHDCVAGTMKALDAKADGLVFNLGREQPISIMELAVKIRNLAGSSSPIVLKSYEEAYGPGYEDMPARIPDITRARTILGYDPKVSLDEGLAQTIEWFRQNSGK